MKTLALIFLGLLCLVVSPKATHKKMSLNTPTPAIKHTDSLYTAVLRLEESAKKLQKITP